MDPRVEIRLSLIYSLTIIAVISVIKKKRKKSLGYGAFVGKISKASC